MASRVGGAQGPAIRDAYVAAVVSQGQKFIDVACNLLSKSVCPRCCLRYCNLGHKLGGVIGGTAPDAKYMLDSLKSRGMEGSQPQKTRDEAVASESVNEASEPDWTCVLCLGILQNLDREQRGGECSSADFWESLPFADAEKKWRLAPSLTGQCLNDILNSSEHQFQDYGLDISLSDNVMLRDAAMFRSLRAELGLFPLNEFNFLRLSVKHWPVVTVADAAKQAIVAIINRTSGCPSSNGSLFRLCLNYQSEQNEKDVSPLAAQCRPSNAHNGTRRGRGRHGRGGGRFNKRKREEKSDTLAELLGCAGGMNDENLNSFFSIPPSPVSEPTKVLVRMVQNQTTYVAGRYRKLSREISQTEFIVDGKRKGKTSVQEIIEGVVLPLFRADSLTFIPAGREDMDVRMLGDGRPFVLELQNPREHTISRSVLEKTEASFDISQGVEVSRLRMVSREHVMRMKDGEKDKAKRYAAIVWITREVTDADFEKLNALKNLEINQETPLRVAHRRAALERKKEVHWVKCDRIEGKSNYFVMWLQTSAGTYIKELVHSDMGRTVPSIASLLGCDAVCVQLDVVDVIMEELDSTEGKVRESESASEKGMLASPSKKPRASVEECEVKGGRAERGEAEGSK
ncbi:hypothetical protein BSKO_08412 [Bryopsis sp. KO-2023]|nr:hypothetical protein BSKO_08412 [Bryopsis sp. KO-2023]